MMDLTKLSTSYQVRRLNPQDADHVLKLVLSNDSYYNFCPPRPNRHTILEDIKVVPANKTMDDKYYVGFYDQDKLIAVLDLISGYPDEKTAWIGFFMVDAAVQGKGIGSKIFVGIESELKDLGLSRVELAFAKGNAKSEKFLLKNGYQKTGQELNVPGYTVVVVEKML
ncbi:GNAT family N-acetyltransferase [Companilactobacillus farciminis]|uniref:GNAT family N-acetyltransferase n=1 Tax=Companilactobacillus farciminis TaxID=1612 RepID=UPI00232B5F21|nr:GNAT family N-acetyltransferase [Companilactobacillus farciminis]WCG35135.1 GNAT family N-acetyltransferase [Companilactobacillus farciminis]